MARRETRVRKFTDANLNNDIQCMNALAGIVLALGDKTYKGLSPDEATRRYVEEQRLEKLIQLMFGYGISPKTHSDFLQMFVAFAGALAEEFVKGFRIVSPGEEIGRPNHRPHRLKQSDWVALHEAIIEGKAKGQTVNAICMKATKTMPAFNKAEPLSLAAMYRRYVREIRKPRKNIREEIARQLMQGR